MFTRKQGRSLTKAETELARSIFKGAIDYSLVRVHERKYWFFHPKRVTMAPDGHLWYHPKSGLFCDNFCDKPLHIQAHFLHEMTHVWQHQSGIFLPLRRLPFAPYHYSIRPGWKLAQYGIEQQAEIVRHTFLLRKGSKVIGAPPLDVYESILPF